MATTAVAINPVLSVVLNSLIVHLPHGRTTSPDDAPATTDVAAVEAVLTGNRQVKGVIQLLGRRTGGAGPVLATAFPKRVPSTPSLITIVCILHSNYSQSFKD